MLKNLIAAIMIASVTPAMAHSDSKYSKGPNGGHIVDAGGGKQHWELVASGGDLTLYVADSVEKPVDTAGGKAEGKVLVGGKNYTVEFAPAGENMLKAKGDFQAEKGMKVIVKTRNVGGESFQARFTPKQ
jgi:hypothetical protein